MFNIEKQASQAQLRDMIHYLCFIDAISVEGIEYPKLHLGPRAKAIFKAEEKVTMPLHELKKGKEKKEPKRHALGGAFEDSEESPLLQRLRALRSTLAKEKRVPPYMIFHDRSLKEMAWSGVM